VIVIILGSNFLGNNVRLVVSRRKTLVANNTGHVEMRRDKNFPTELEQRA